MIFHSLPSIPIQILFEKKKIYFPFLYLYLFYYFIFAISVLPDKGFPFFIHELGFKKLVKAWDVKILTGKRIPIYSLNTKMKYFFFEEKKKLHKTTFFTEPGRFWWRWIIKQVFKMVSNDVLKKLKAELLYFLYFYKNLKLFI